MNLAEMLRLVYEKRLKITDTVPIRYRATKTSNGRFHR